MKKAIKQFVMAAAMVVLTTSFVFGAMAAKLVDDEYYKGIFILASMISMFAAMYVGYKSNDNK